MKIAPHGMATRQHHRNATGALDLKTGGSVRTPALLKSGTPDTPLENAKRANGIPGMKKGGKC